MRMKHTMVSIKNILHNKPFMTALLLALCLSLSLGNGVYAAESESHETEQAEKEDGGETENGETDLEPAPGGQADLQTEASFYSDGDTGKSGGVNGEGPEKADAESIEPAADSGVKGKADVQQSAESVNIDSGNTYQEPGTNSEGSDPCLEGHDYVPADYIEATCTTYSELIFECSRCGDRISEFFSEPLGHKWEQDYEDDQLWTCSRCKMQHDGNPYVSDYPDADESVRKITYFLDGQFLTSRTVPFRDEVKALVLSRDRLDSYGLSKFYVGYQFTGWATEEDGSGDFYREGDMLPPFDDYTLYGQFVEKIHVHHLKLVRGRAATCDQGGTEDCWVCSICDRMFSDRKGNTEISEPAATPPTGHQEPGTNSEGSDPCLEGHDYVLADYIPATCTTYAEFHYECRRCGDRISEFAREPLGHDWVEVWKGPDQDYICSRCKKESDINPDVKAWVEGHYHDESVVRMTYFLDGQFLESWPVLYRGKASALVLTWERLDSWGFSYLYDRYQFTGWTTEEDGSGDFYREGDTLPTKDSLKLYGQFVEKYHVHDLNIVQGKAATCEQGGTEDCWVCSICDRMFSDMNGNTEISEPAATPPTGHDWGDWQLVEATLHTPGKRICTCRNDPAHVKTEEFSCQIDFGYSSKVNKEKRNLLNAAVLSMDGFNLNNVEYFEVELQVSYDDGKTFIPLKETEGVNTNDYIPDSGMTVTLTLPKEIHNTAKYDLAILHLEDSGKIETITDYTLNKSSGSVSFRVHSLSPFAIAYKKTGGKSGEPLNEDRSGNKKASASQSSGGNRSGTVKKTSARAPETADESPVLPYVIGMTVSLLCLLAVSLAGKGLLKVSTSSDHNPGEDI